MQDYGAHQCVRWSDFENEGAGVSEGDHSHGDECKVVAIVGDRGLRIGGVGAANVSVMAENVDQAGQKTTKHRCQRDPARQ